MIQTVTTMVDVLYRIALCNNFPSVIRMLGIASLSGLGEWKWNIMKTKFQSCQSKSVLTLVWFCIIKVSYHVKDSNNFLDFSMKPCHSFCHRKAKQTSNLSRKREDCLWRFLALNFRITSYYINLGWEFH